MSDDLEPRRTAIDVNQQTIAEILQKMECEAALLLVPAHVAWFCSGFNSCGLQADGERPGIYTNGKQRWLVCSNVDSQRIFEEELDQLGFQLKEWNWQRGRAPLIGELVTGKRVAIDRPFSNMPLINDHLRGPLRPLNESVRGRYQALGKGVAHALEAAARGVVVGETEEEVAGSLAHRLLRHGVEPSQITVAADGRLEQSRRHGFTSKSIDNTVTLQVTGSRDGLFVTSSRTVCLTEPTAELLNAYERCCRLSAVWRSVTQRKRSFADLLKVSSRVLGHTPFEHELRHSPIGYGTGWYPAEELKRMGKDEPFVEHQALVQRASLGPALVTDTLLVGSDVSVTACDNWPYKRLMLMSKEYDIPDILKR